LKSQTYDLHDKNGKLKPQTYDLYDKYGQSETTDLDANDERRTALWTLTTSTNWAMWKRTDRWCLRQHDGGRNRGSSTRTIKAIMTSPPNVDRTTSAFIADTRCNGNYLMINSSPCTYMHSAVHRIAIPMPNGAHIQSTQNKLLNPLDLPVTARQAYIFPALSSRSFLSVGLLCYRGCEATLSRHVKRHGPTILTGHRRRDRLWMIQHPTPQPVSVPAANVSS
jgi:hypothetical protein